MKFILSAAIDLPTVGKNINLERNVVELVSHECYNRYTLYNDVALLFLDKPYEEGEDFLKTICLPPKNFVMEGKRCIVAGWGKEPNNQSKYIKNDGMEISNRSKKVFFSIVNLKISKYLQSVLPILLFLRSNSGLPFD